MILNNNNQIFGMALIFKYVVYALLHNGISAFFKVF